MQALFDLAHHSHGQPVPLHAIAQRQELSLPFLEQIFNKLKKSGVVTSVRGPKGGYVLTRPCNLITVGARQDRRIEAGALIFALAFARSRNLEGGFFSRRHEGTKDPSLHAPCSPPSDL